MISGRMSPIRREELQEMNLCDFNSPKSPGPVTHVTHHSLASPTVCLWSKPRRPVPHSGGPFSTHGSCRTRGRATRKTHNEQHRNGLAPSPDRCDSKHGCCVSTRRCSLVLSSDQVLRHCAQCIT